MYIARTTHYYYIIVTRGYMYIARITEMASIRLPCQQCFMHAQKTGEPRTGLKITLDFPWVARWLVA
jgi:hypothetical protein